MQRAIGHTPPDHLPVLSRGKHHDPHEGACLMEYVSVLAGEQFSDSPRCTHKLLSRIAQIVNDASSVQARSELARRAPLLIGATGSGSETGQRLVEACYAVAAQASPRWREPRLRLIRTLRRWSRAEELGVEHALRALQCIPRRQDRDAALHRMLDDAIAVCRRDPRGATPPGTTAQPVR